MTVKSILTVSSTPTQSELRARLAQIRASFDRLLPQKK